MKPLVVIRFDGSSGALIEPEPEPFVVDHATDQATFVAHRPIHGQPKAFHPKTEAFFQIGAGYDGNARFNKHRNIVRTKAPSTGFRTESRKPTTRPMEPEKQKNDILCPKYRNCRK